MYVGGTVDGESRKYRKDGEIREQRRKISVPSISIALLVAAIRSRLLGTYILVGMGTMGWSVNDIAIRETRVKTPGMIHEVLGPVGRCVSVET